MLVVRNLLWLVELLNVISIVIWQSHLTFISIFNRPISVPSHQISNSCALVLLIILADGGDLHRPEKSSPHPGKTPVKEDQSGPRYSHTCSCLLPCATPSVVCQVCLWALTSTFFFHIWLLQTCREACSEWVFWSPFGPHLSFKTASTWSRKARNGAFFFWVIEDGRQQTSQSGGPSEIKKEEELGSTVLWETQRELHVCSLAECGDQPTLGDLVPYQGALRSSERGQRPS